MGVRTLVGQKTYSHLLGSRRAPSTYEITTSRLHYYVEQGFSVHTPVTAWYERHQRGSPLRATDWEAFADPAETTYASYTKVRATREVHASELLRGAPEWDGALAAEQKAATARSLGVLRFPRHALMMVAGYVGSLAPSGRITAASAFQVGDELRHVHRLAERSAQLHAVDAVARDARAGWTGGPGWQPLRRLVEHLLVTYDWGESFAALNLVVKPMLDAVAITALAARAASAGDAVTAGVLRSLDEDAAWQRAWSAALVGVAIVQDAANRSVLEGWIDAWKARTVEACAAAAEALGVESGGVLVAHERLAAACGLMEAA